LKPEETVDFHLKSTWQSVSRMYNEIASTYGGTMATGYILLNIDPEGTPSTSLGPRMGMEATSLSRTLKSMEDKELIWREKSSDDKRVVFIHLTKEGKRMRDLARSTVVEFNKKVFEQIPKEKLMAFFYVSSQINRIIETDFKNKL
jgi:MarR family transcriptional regulator, organic hydroperoxide resistance regulator